MKQLAFFDSNDLVLNVIVVNDEIQQDEIETFRDLFNATKTQILEPREIAIIGQVGTEQVQQPYDSWTFDEESKSFVPPTLCPGEGYIWDESQVMWIIPVYETESE
jgi:hypothetical protein